MSQSTDWQSSHHRAYSRGIRLALIGTWFLLLFVFRFPIQISLLFLLVICVSALALTYSTYQENNHTIEKVFGAPPEDATKIVSYILDNKQLPYRKSWRNPRYEYAITNSELVIAVSEQKIVRRNRLGFWDHSKPSASLVTIEPTTAENLPLIQSLQGKLDEAFTPAGLQASADTLAIKFRTETNAKQK